MDRADEHIFERRKNVVRVAVRDRLKEPFERWERNRCASLAQYPESRLVTESSAFTEEGNP